MREMYPNLACIEVANKTIGDSASCRSDAWKRRFAEALDWREVGEPEEAATQLFALLNSHVEDISGEESRSLKDQALCQYAMCRAGSLLKVVGEGDLQDEWVPAEQSLCALQIEQETNGRVLSDADRASCMRIALGGMLGRLSRCRTLDDTAAVLLEALESMDPVRRRLGTLAYVRLMLAIADDGLVPDSLNTPQIRIALKDMLFASWQEELSLGSDSRKYGWHEVFPRVLEEYRRRWAELAAAIRSCIEADDLVAIDIRRQSLLKVIRRFETYCTEYEIVIIREIHEVFSRLLTDYLRERDTTSIKAFEILDRRLRALVNRPETGSSRLGVCLLMPVAQHVLGLVKADHTARLQQKAPKVTVSLAKPYYPLTPAGAEIEILLHIINAGQLEAPDSKVLLEVREDHRDFVQIQDPERLDLLFVSSSTILCRAPIGTLTEMW